MNKNVKTLNLPSLKESLALPRPLFGVILTLPCPEIAEMCADAGFDWLFIDLEHSAISLKDAQRMLIAAAAKAYTLIRCPGLEEISIKRCLDLGADGVIIPRIRTAKEAQRALEWCMYPPAGIRSAGLGRAQKYGAGFKDYVLSANKNTVVVLQAEDREAVNNIRSILDVEGIGGIFIGPYDLSGSFGALGDTENPDVQAGIKRIRGACETASVPTGIFCPSLKQALQYAKEGYKLIALGSDGLIFHEGARRLLKDIGASQNIK